MAVFTEKEARDKMKCCGPRNCGIGDRFSIAGYAGLGGMNAQPAAQEVEGQRMCEGSTCAAWRWAKATTIQEAGTPDTYFPPDEKQGAVLAPNAPPGEGWVMLTDQRQLPGWHTWRRISTEGARGYCGLAGKPETF